MVRAEHARALLRSAESFSSVRSAVECVFWEISAPCKTHHSSPRSSSPSRPSKADCRSSMMQECRLCQKSPRPWPGRHLRRGLPPHHRRSRHRSAQPFNNMRSPDSSRSYATSDSFAPANIADADKPDPLPFFSLSPSLRARTHTQECPKTNREWLTRLHLLEAEAWAPGDTCFTAWRVVSTNEAWSGGGGCTMVQKSASKTRQRNCEWSRREKGIDEGIA